MIAHVSGIPVEELVPLADPKLDRRWHHDDAGSPVVRPGKGEVVGP
jgi:hypothetical protein